MREEWIMTSKLFQNHDGADKQARAVLAYLSSHDGIECSWDAADKAYEAYPTVARWYNCREQGYVISMRSSDFERQINIAFFEHRNSDEIVAVEWEQVTINPPTINSMDTGGKVYRDKYDVSHSEPYGEVAKMAKWIYERLEQFWGATAKREVANAARI